MARRALALLLGLALALAAGEALARWGAWDLRLLGPLVPLQVSDPELHQPLAHPLRLYGLKPGLDLTLPNGSPWTDAPRRVRTNRLGLRDPERPATPEGLRILCVGGSHTFGPAVSDHETWPAALERALADRGVQAEAWNLGLSGAMGRQKVALLDEVLRETPADLVIIQLYNEGRLFVLDGTPLRWRMETAPALWAEYVSGAPEPGEGWLFWRSALWRALRVARHRLAVRGDPEGAQAALIERARRLDLAALQGFIARSPAPVVLLVPPAGGDWPEGAPVIDLHAAEQPFGDEGADLHPGPRVYAWEGGRVAEALLELGLVSRE